MGGVAAAARADTPLLSAAPRHCAVVGAGAAGLAAARVLRAVGHVVTGFDKGRKVGGRMALPAEGLHYGSDGCLGDGIRGAIQSGEAAAHALLHTFELAVA